MSELREALARGYCTERNEHKVLDPDLIEDMAKEIEALLPTPEPAMSADEILGIIETWYGEDLSEGIISSPLQFKELVKRLASRLSKPEAEKPLEDSPFYTGKRIGEEAKLKAEKPTPQRIEPLDISQTQRYYTDTDEIWSVLDKIAEHIAHLEEER